MEFLSNSNIDGIFSELFSFIHSILLYFSFRLTPFASRLNTPAKNFGLKAFKRPEWEKNVSPRHQSSGTNNIFETPVN